MKILSKRSGSGRRISALLPIGLLIALFLFLRGRSSSPAEKIKSILIKNGFSERMATWWVAVSNLETGRWTSTLFKKYNNCFGMKQPLIRFTMSEGASVSPPGYATFASVDDSVQDLAIYMVQNLYPFDFNSIDEMVAFMAKKKYFEDPDYLRKVKSRL